MCEQSTVVLLSDGWDKQAPIGSIDLSIAEQAWDSKALFDFQGQKYVVEAAERKTPQGQHVLYIRENTEDAQTH